MENEFVRSQMQKEPQNYGSLGKGIKISPRACVSLNKPGFLVEFYVPTVQVMIGIGNNHTGYLVMEEDAWKALKEGAEVNVTTLKQFKKEFL